ncbi:tripeptidyl-peptidase sed4 [Elsinoe ampelina]|uniref:tripeptidyl-peptidase II n=1 Tax=Elsinoe ampelina TaxID=302913 RepID=A0A6A6GPP6_9PEZI|nr:tripeptidyl-peptidase sed4 [Elsinoe ampelina]
MKLAILTGLLATALTSFAASIPQLVRHESIELLPDGWRVRSVANDADLLHLQIALKHTRNDYLDIANEVSDPDSPRYGQYLEKYQLEAIIPDLGDHAGEIMRWLQTSGASRVRHQGDFIDFETTVENARVLLHANFKYYQYGTEKPILRTQSYNIPSKYGAMIDFIYPTIHFMRTSQTPPKSLVRRQHIPTGPVTCAISICPRNLTSEYNVTYVPQDNKSGSRLGVAGFLEQWPSQKDTQKFLKDYGLRNRSIPYKYNTVLLDGGQNPNDPSKAGAEATLDIEYAMAMADPLPVTYFSTGGRPPLTLSQPGNKVVPQNESGNEPYLSFFRHILSLPNPPQVLSISYADDEQSVPLPYARKVCSLAAQLAARGVSIIVSSGDGGAAGNGDKTCKGPNGKKRFVPTFPASCPWVTAVGATNEYGVAHYSSGGFSNYFPRPKWQEGQVKGYLASLNGSHTGWYNKTGRGIPDVSLFGSDYLTYGGGYAYQQKGTSASTPVFAAMIALLNDKRLREGKPVLGFLNPLLYRNKQVWRDVTEGETDGCQNGKDFEIGWQAAKGWDAASGLGEMDFEKMMQVLK